MEQLAKKKELIEWLMALENEEILDEICELKKKTTSDFENASENLLTLEEYRTETKKQIETFR